MRRIYLILFGFVLGLSSFLFGNKELNTNAPLDLEFNILADSIPNFKSINNEERANFEVFAHVKQTNLTDTTLRLILPFFFLFEHMELRNSKDLQVNHLLNQYDYSLTYNPDDFSFNESLIPPLGSITDTLNFGHDLAITTSDTFSIRIFKTISQDTIYSNWDTLIVY